MTFDNVHQALNWFFNFKQADAPRLPGNHSYAFQGAGKRRLEIQNVWETFHKMNELLQGISPKEYAILEDCYRDGPTDRGLSIKLRISDRRIRQIKCETVICLERKMALFGLLSKPKYEKPNFLVA